MRRVPKFVVATGTAVALVGLMWRVVLANHHPNNKLCYPAYYTDPDLTNPAGAACDGVIYDGEVFCDPPGPGCNATREATWHDGTCEDGYDGQDCVLGNQRVPVPTYKAACDWDDTCNCSWIPTANGATFVMNCQ